MRVLVYEHLTATGPDGGSSMHREGRAMRDALTADLRAIPDIRVVEENPDLAIVIAPETDGILEAVVAEMRRKHSVLASSSEALALTRDKLALFHHWSAHGVPTPCSSSVEDWPRSRVPAVVKPVDGAGSCDMWLCRTERDFERLEKGLAQDYVPGRAASVAFLIGPKQTVPLVPTFQHLERFSFWCSVGWPGLSLRSPGVRMDVVSGASKTPPRPPHRCYSNVGTAQSDDGRFAYLGGELPIPAPLAERAISLGRRAVDCVPGLAGYVGVDLVLGESANEDRAIEINPRLTTSYVGLRALADCNLAAAMLAVHRGEPVGELHWKTGPLRFFADGTRTINLARNNDE